MNARKHFSPCLYGYIRLNKSDFGQLSVVMLSAGYKRNLGECWLLVTSCVKSTVCMQRLFD